MTREEYFKIAVDSIASDCGLVVTCDQLERLCYEVEESMLEFDITQNGDPPIELGSKKKDSHDYEKEIRLLKDELREAKKTSVRVDDFGKVWLKHPEAQRELHLKNIVYNG